MSLSEISIRRPVLAWVMTLTILLFGFLGYIQLGVREYPAVDPPVVTVSTGYGGASPEIIDTQITEPIEQALSGIAGIRDMASTSREGQSSIRVEFTLNTDIEAAANDVRDKVAGVVRRLPADADPPTVEKADADSDPVIFLAVQSDKHDILEISNTADTVIKERVQTIPGVSTVRIFGEKRFAMRLWLDPDKMAAHGVTPLDVYDALRDENVDLPSGRLEGTSTELSLRTDGRLTTPEEFDNLVIREEGARQIMLRDVGHAELSAENLRRGNVSRGIPMNGVAIIPQPNTNAIEIADEFFRRYDRIKEELAGEYELDIGYDFTTFVRASIDEVIETIAVAFILVTAIIFLFLRDWRSVLVPVLAIPISIIPGFFIMYVAGFSINVLTLVALVLAIGLVCDDAIVVLENIYSKVEEGQPPLRAAITGSREIFFAVISTTCALAAVFVPVIFLQGLTGRLFREFGITMVGCILFSSFVALTLSPMLCRNLLKPHQHHSWFYRVTEPFFVFLTSAYERTLRLFLRWRLLALPVLAAAVAATVAAAMNLQTELAPVEDRSNMRIALRAPEGATYEYTTERTNQLAAYLEEKFADDIHRVFAISGAGGGVNSSFINIYLKNPLERTRDAFTIFADVQRELLTRTDLRAAPSMPPTIGDRRAGQPVQFVLQAPNFAELSRVLPLFLEKAGQQAALRFVDSDLKTNRPQVRLTLNRAKAADLGVSAYDVARTLQLALGDTRFGYFIMNDRQYQVIGQLLREFRNKPGDLDLLRVRSSRGELIPLSSLVETESSVSPAALYRYNRYPSATITAGLAPGATLGDGLAAMRQVAAEVLPNTFTTSLSGQSRDFEESSSSLLYAFILALVLIYLVLAAQFESWMDPFIIMLTVPLSMAGAVVSLWVFGQSLNVFSEIGIIMLIGLVTKNGILIVEFANQRRQLGNSKLEAAAQAATLRFRPILMTSLSTILGILPIALALGGSAGSRQSMGIAVVGGLTLATVLTLYVVPAMYAFLASERVASNEDDEEAPPTEGPTAGIKEFQAAG